MSKRLLFLIVPTAAAFVLLLGVIAVDFVRVRTGAMPGEAPGLAAYLSTAGGRLEATREASQKVAAIGVTPPAPEEAKQAQAAPEKKAQPADTETQTVSVEVAQAGAGSSWFGLRQPQGGPAGGCHLQLFDGRDRREALCVGCPEMMLSRLHYLL